ncbi:MAG: class B sortase [Agathobacter sp.]|nr:class B sortase [Agathobacter sp.]
MNKKKSGDIYKIICIILLIILIGIVAVWGYRIIVENRANSKYEEIQNTVNSAAKQAETEAVIIETETEEETETETEEVQNAFDIPEKNLDWTSLYAENKDIYAWIYIPGTQVDYPVLQNAADDTYYLNHNIDGSYGKPGCIYTEKINSKDFTNYNTVLYGHNMKNGEMFGCLHDYEDKTFFDENPYVYVYTEEKTYVYEIFAAYTATNAHILNTNDFSTQEGFADYLDNVVYNKALTGNFRNDTRVTSDNRIITLSTCTSNSSKRWLVQAVLVN